MGLAYQRHIGHSALPAPTTVLMVGWVRSVDDVEEMRRAAGVVVGEELVGVRYLTIDYGRFEIAPTHRGPRFVTDLSEWFSPPWLCGPGDSVDFGVELDLASGRALSVTWEAPGNHESLDVFPGRLIDSALYQSPDVAAWDVSSTPRWRQLVGHPITAVDLHFIPWAPDDGFWCTRVAFSFGTQSVVLMLGEIAADGQIAPSADNVAVLFSPNELPAWELR